MKALAFYEDAEAFILVNMTAWRMLVTQARLRAIVDAVMPLTDGTPAQRRLSLGK